ncbi:hypothetical protein C8R42DRAFT_582613, partial [Lentinula raphanica]
LQKLTLNICECRSAPVQLIERGLFGSAPKEPTLAVDVRVLDFVTRLFLRISPNHTGVSNTIEDFLKCQGYQMKGKDPLRRRFTMALRWYNALQQATTQSVDSYLEIERQQLTAVAPSSPPSTPTAETEAESSGDRPSKRARHEEEECTIAGSRPSQYLRSRCPLCFGGKSDFAHGTSFIVCLDACFNQKHNKQTRDPKHVHPRSVFLAEEHVEHWKNVVEEQRPSRHTTNPARSSADDEVEEGMQVPKSVLDACNDSFTAADGYREKASTQFFDSTALMGLLCRHDRVLWLVNMTTPGERQHYALALLDQLFNHIPSTSTVGLLYDIACQLERSCVKWGFMKNYLPRMRFAISVFHAFGHGWGCQCVYHPRKCTGFGLSDGEGCERFWHSISKLIAYLRVCGHYIRLYTLDSQIQHADNESLIGFGHWIARKWKLVQTKREEAEQNVRWSTHDSDFLHEQWEEQKSHTVKPSPRKCQSRTAGKQAIEEALRLRKSRDTLRQSIKDLEDIIASPSSEPYEIAEAELELPLLKEKFKKAQSTLSAKENNLGVDGERQYRHLASSPFITDRMNARALKIRLRQRLQARKFERDRLERSFRRQMNASQRKLHRHTEDTVKQRDGGIQSLARNYNKLCERMSERIAKKNAPANAIAPRPIPMKELFSLDIDDAIWDDCGLEGEDNSAGPPLWLSDEQVRVGIQGILLRDRCDEELLRLKHEIRVMEDWFAEEWRVVVTAISNTQGILLIFLVVTISDRESSDIDLQYQLWDRRINLTRLSILWTQALNELPSEFIPSFVGPTSEELREVEHEIQAELVDQVCDDDDDDDSSELDEDDLDIGLIEHIDALTVADTYIDIDDNLA